jgi:hypothetical protein
MREIDAAAREHANYARSLRCGQRVNVQVDGGRARHGGDLRKHVASDAGQPPKAKESQVAVILRYWQRAPCRHRTKALDLAGDLQRVERVASCRLMDSHQHWSGERLAQCLQDQPVKRGDAHRAERHAINVLAAQSRLERCEYR